RLFPDLEDPEHTFIVLNANRPVFRKRLDLTLEGFALFAAGKPANVKLCLHQAHVDELTPHLLELASKHGLESRLLYNPLNPDGGAIPDEELNQLYGACDVGLNTSAGEGWGLVSFEHAATGGAQIVPLSTACTSLWTEQTALRIIPVDFAETPMSELELAYVDPVDVAAALERLYRDREHARILAKSGYEHVMHSQFQWSTISGQWRELFGTAVSRFRAETRVSE
ncbi:glycosyltransferase, partial [Nisaea sp.]